MAHGRMLNKSISLNKELADLNSDTSRLLFTWTISHLDVEGRIHGDPDVLKSLVVPRLKHITGEVVEECIKEWTEKGLVIWYEAGGDQWLQFPGFHDNQKGLKKDREAQSKIPAPEEGEKIPTHEEIMSNSGVTHDKVLPNRKESKLIEKNTSAASPEPNGSKKQLQTTGNVKKDLSPLKDDIAQYWQERITSIQPHSTWSNYGKERKACGDLAKRTRGLLLDVPYDSPEKLADDVLGVFLHFKKTARQDYWARAPATPSAVLTRWSELTAELARKWQSAQEASKYDAEVPL